MNAAAVDGFRHTCRRILDEKRVHEIVGTTDAERSGQVNFSPEDAEKFVAPMADRTMELQQNGKGWALAGALEAGQKLTPMLVRIHWTLLEAPVAEPWQPRPNR